MVLHVYHAAIGDKEFEFQLEIGTDTPNSFNEAVSKAIDETSQTMLEQVSPVMCWSCKSAPAVQLLHHPMLFDKVVPPRVEDMPQPVCSSSECYRHAHDSMRELITSAVPEIKEQKVCFNCHLARNDVQLMQCSRCKVAKYCNAQCQKMHWPIHKRVCQVPGTAAAPAQQAPM